MREECTQGISVKWWNIVDKLTMGCFYHDLWFGFWLVKLFGNDFHILVLVFLTMSLLSNQTTRLWFKPGFYERIFFLLFWEYHHAFMTICMVQSPKYPPNFLGSAFLKQLLRTIFTLLSWKIWKIVKKVNYPFTFTIKIF